MIRRRVPVGGWSLLTTASLILLQTVFVFLVVPAARTPQSDGLGKEGFLFVRMPVAGRRAKTGRSLIFARKIKTRRIAE